jgi:hypothetical protein
VTVSPDSMVKIGLSVGLKWPMWTVCGLGISVYSAAFRRSVMNPIETATMLAVNRIEMWDLALAIRLTP